MKKTETRLPDCFVLDPVVHGDERGFFVESWNDRTFTEIGLNLTFVQDNHSRSGMGVLRGLHYRGAIFDISYCNANMTLSVTSGANLLGKLL